MLQGKESLRGLVSMTGGVLQGIEGLRGRHSSRKGGVLQGKEGLRGIHSSMKGVCCRVKKASGA